MIYETIYKNLIRIAPEILKPDFEYRKLEAPGFMDLHVDGLVTNTDKIIVALAHNYRHPSGDTIPDPDMEVAIYPDRQRAEALSYQDFFGYREVYPEPGQVSPGAKDELNRFLDQWLRNIIEQGHR